MQEVHSTVIRLEPRIPAPEAMEMQQSVFAPACNKHAKDALDKTEGQNHKRNSPVRIRKVDFNEWDALIRVIFFRRRKTLRRQFTKLCLGPCTHL